jgi:small-conductance mechanosensitive channel
MLDFNLAAAESWLGGHGLRILIIVAVGVGLWFFLQRFIRPVVYHAVKQTKGESREGIRKRTDTLTGVFVSTGKVLIVLTIILMILSELDIPIGPALAGLGIAGVALGFGAQYLVRDLIAGVFVILENQYRVGDVVKVADIVGMVEEVNLRRTVLRDLDGIVHHVPNGEIRVAGNYSRHFSRVNLDISVAYGTDLDHAIKVINRVGKELARDKNWRDRIRNAPEVLRVAKLGDSGIEIKILGEVIPLAQWEVAGELRLRLKKAFDKEGIEIPWPHLKLYFGESPADSGLVCQACSQVNLPGSKFCSRCGAKLKR